MTRQPDILAWLDNAITLCATVAKLAAQGGSGSWYSGGTTDDPYVEEWELESAVVYDADSPDTVIVSNGVWPSKDRSVHIALHDPASVLRRCEADRKLLELHQPISCRSAGCDCDSCCATCRWTGSDEAGKTLRWGETDKCVYPCPTLRALAEGYGWTGVAR